MSMQTTKLVSTCQDLSGLKFLDRFMSCQMVILTDQVKTRLAILRDQIYQLRIANHLQGFGFKETHKPSFFMRHIFDAVLRMDGDVEG